MAKVKKLRRPNPPVPKPEPRLAAFAVYVPRDPAVEGTWKRFPGGRGHVQDDPEDAA
jgi:hypothetical protein